MAGQRPAAHDQAENLYSNSQHAVIYLSLVDRDIYDLVHILSIFKQQKP
jgi:hypothetical protein